MNNRVNQLRVLMYRFGKNKNIEARNEIKERRRHRRIRGHDIMFLNSINEIGNGEPIRMSQVSQYFKISAPAISQIARRLEKLGYIERIIKDDDRRSVYIQVSQKARDEIEYAEAKINKSMKEIIEYLGDEDSDELIRILEKVVTFIDEKERG